MSAYNKLRGPAPFSQTTRFPDDLFVHLDNDALKLWFEQLLHALDMPDRMMERDRTAVVDITSVTTVTDAKRAFDIAFSRLAEIVRSVDIGVLNKYGVYDRLTFEKTFGLSWLDNSIGK